MRGQEFAPGDVALVRNQFGVWNRAICAVRSGHRGFVWSYGVADDTSPMTADARPLVVIDPEDAEQVDRLVRCFWEANTDAGDADAIYMATALHEFADPTPRIEEPTGLGAVVEDDEGRLWVLFGNGCWIKTVPNAGLWQKSWAGLNAARVLSEGVPS